MTGPTPPTGYDVSKAVQAGRRDCQITVGFDRQQGHIPRFLVQLHYIKSTSPLRWKDIARIDHNETSTTGHNVYREGLHVDVDRRSSKEVQLKLRHGPLPRLCGTVIRGCVDYFKREAAYFINVYEEQQAPGGPPGWPDGGEPTRNFIRPDTVRRDMDRKSSAEEPLSSKELTELLAQSEDTTPEEIEQGAANLEIAPPEEAMVVEDE